MTTPPAVEVDDVAVSLGGTRVLDGIDLTVAEGELVALLGPSGCGKTTLLRIIAGLQTASAGRVRLGGRDVTSVTARERPIGMVFQNYALFPTMTALDNVAFPLRVARGATAPERRAGELLELVGMAGFEDRRPSELSGGQQQRVALARALARDPEVLLLDEPLSALDAVIRDNLRDEIRALQRRLGLAVVHVTHDQSEALAMADRVAVMDRGRIVEIGAPEDLYRRPRAVFTARFVGGRNEVPLAAHPAAGRAWHDALRLVDADDDVVAALFPPESVILGPEGDGAPAVVVISSFHGATVRLHLEVGDQRVVAERPASEAAAFAPGTRCGLRVAPEAVTPVTSADSIPFAPPRP